MEQPAANTNIDIWETIYKERTSGSYLQYPCEDLVVSVNRYLAEERFRAGRVLDVGFGSGNNLSFLASRGFDCYGVDVSQSALEIAQARLEKEGKHAELKVISGSQYPYEDSFFDCVIAWHVLSYNDAQGVARSLSEIKRVVKKNGLILATFPTFKEFRVSQGCRLKDSTFIFKRHGSNQDGALVTAAKTPEQAREIFSMFAIFEIGYSEITVKGVTNSHWLVFAQRP